MKTSRTEISGDYVTGLCEGIATFTYLKNGNALNLRFAVKAASGDKNIIFQLQHYFGTGNVYNADAMWMFCATSLVAIEKIVDHFDRYPLKGRKQEEFLVWRQMFELKRLPRKCDMAILMNLADRLSSLKKS